MKTIFHRGNVLVVPGIFLFLLFFTESLTAQPVYYVTPGGTGSGTGSWSNAAGATISLQAIIDAAPASSQVWVAAGTYAPTAYPAGTTGGSSARDFAFELKNGVGIYGGFTGMETALNQRDPVANVTILSGAANNSYHVLLSPNNDNTAILEGFTIQSGNANGFGSLSYISTPVPEAAGGGIAAYMSSAIISNCIITANKGLTGGGIAIAGGSLNLIHSQITQNNSTTYGGGISNLSGTPVISFCKFENNKASYGGGIYNDGGGGLYFTDTLHGNTATSASGMGGGGMFNDAASPTLVRCLLDNNVTSAGADGGCIYNRSSNPIDSNCVFVSNIAKLGNGGAIYNSSGSPENWNCLFVSNSSNKNGGAVYIASGNGRIVNSTFYNNGADYMNAGDPAAATGGGVYIAAGTTGVFNNIIWGNTSGLVIASSNPAGALSVQYNDIQGGSYTTNGNIGGDPLFIGGPPAGADGIYGTSDDGLQLISGPTPAVASPAMDAGTSAAGESINYDFLYVARPIGAGIDMGAYEAPPPTTLAIAGLNLLAAASGSGPVLQWQSNSELPVDNYVLWRSADGGKFNVIATIPAVAGQTNYVYTDRGAKGEVISYRVEAVLESGTGLYSSVAVVGGTADETRVGLYPSVIGQGSVTLSFGVTRNITAGVVITDATGKIMKHQSVALLPGNTLLSLDMGAFPAGLYYVCVSGPQLQNKVLPLLRL
jgi:hypothetical protein